MYKAIIRPFLFLLNPETAHHFTFSLLNFVSRIPGIPALLRSLYRLRDSRLETDFCGLKLPNPVGLAAGFDKDAKAIDPLANLGFGFIEIGTVTPKPQPGNEKPRMFRLPADGALINRMGFNNEGIDACVGRLKKRRSKVLVGGNIGKNKVTPNEQALDDYLKCLEALYEHVDYFVVNISSPNTPGLRELQEKEPLRKLLGGVKERADELGGKRPVLVKIAPDLSDGQLDDIVEIVKEIGIDGVVATNTTLSREDLNTSASRIEEIGNGGLSGQPLTDRSTEIIRLLRLKLGEGFPILGVGGIMKPDDAIEKLNAGATAIQVYTGFIYGGPGFVSKINRALIKEIEQ